MNRLHKRHLRRGRKNTQATKNNDDNSWWIATPIRSNPFLAIKFLCRRCCRYFFVCALIFHSFTLYLASSQTNKQTNTIYSMYKFYRLLFWQLFVSIKNWTIGIFLSSSLLFFWPYTRLVCAKRMLCAYEKKRWKEE